MTAAGTTRPVEQLPEPARCWIAYSPRSWRSAGGLWTDFANARISGFRGTRGAPMPDFDAAGFDDLFYLPPVVSSQSRARDRLARSLIKSGTPVLIELLPGEKTRVSGAHVVYDLLQVLLKGNLDRLARLPAGSSAVWPLISGLSDRGELWEDGCERLAAVGVRGVQGMVVELDPPVRRRLAEGRDADVFDALFHGETPSEQRFAVCAARHDLEPFLHRPETGAATPRQLRNRKIASELALLGEMWMQLGKTTATGQAFFRAARGAEHTHHDLTALVREDNLTIMDWLDARGVEIVEEVVRDGSSTFLDEILDEYLERSTG